VSSQLELLKKHGPSGLMNTDELIFVYPFMVSSSLDKYSEMLRNFMMVQYLAQIKISNALHVTSSIAKNSRGGRVGFNPAESLYQDLGVGRMQPPIQPDQIGPDKYEQQAQIDKFRDMLVSLVKTEPRFSELEPIVTTITMDNLLTIPIIAASKKFKLAEDVLYWILFAAAGQKTKLDNVNGLSKIEAVLRHIPKENFMELLDPELTERALKDQHSEDAAHARLMDSGESGALRYYNSVKDKLGKSIGLFRTVLNVDKWNTETGINSTYDTSLSAASIKTLGSNQVVLTNSSALFASLISNYVMHLLQSVIHAVVSDTEVDVARIISEASSSIISETNSVNSGLLMGMMAGIQTQQVGSSDVLFKQLEQQCKANSQINISALLNNLQSVRFSISGSSRELGRFAEMMVDASAKATPLYEMLVGFIDNASAGNTPKDYLNANDLVATPENGGSDVNLTGMNISTKNLLDNYGKTVSKILNKAFVSAEVPMKSARFNILVGKDDPTKFVETTISSMTEVIKFLSVYTFYSYFCEYTGELAAEVEVKRQDVMDFPNYCLTVPIEIMKSIYGALSADNFKKMLENPKSAVPEFQDITTQNLNMVIQVIGDRLGVRNIIVVDDKAKVVYYKWMFSKQVQRINLGTMKSYVSSQRDFIKAN